MQRPITHLRHVALGVPDLPATLAFYRDVWGLTVVASDASVAYLAAADSPEPYVLRLREAEAKRVDVIAFGATDPLAVDALAAALDSRGVQIVVEPTELHTPGGGYGFRFFDNEGRTVEVSCDVATLTRDPDSRPAVPVALSHVVLNSASPEDAVAFWEANLGFTVSDVLTMPHMGRLMWFMRCNSWHHSIAFARCGHASLHHVSYEMRSIDEYMYATGRTKRSGAELVWGPGRHLAGGNTFSYFLDPVGNTAEFTTALAEVEDDTWEPHEYSIADPNVADQWGTAEAMSADVAAKSFNSPDAGLFSAPPV